MYQGTLEPVSNRADWIGTLQLLNEDTGTIITDLSDVTVNLVVRRRNEYCSPSLTATFENGKFENLGGGVIEWRFPASEMSQLCADTYDIGITMTRGGVVEQEFIGTVPVIDGVVRR